MIATRCVAAALFTFACCGASLAQCPPPLAGETAAEIRSNEERLLCLQRELNARTTTHSFELQLDAINRQLRELQLQRQVDALKFDVPVYRPR